MCNNIIKIKYASRLNIAKTERENSRSVKMMLQCEFKKQKEAWRGHHDRLRAVGKTPRGHLWDKKCIHKSTEVRDKGEGNARGNCNHIWVVSTQRDLILSSGDHRAQVTPESSQRGQWCIKKHDYWHTETENQLLSRATSAQQAEAGCTSYCGDTVLFRAELQNW